MNRGEIKTLARYWLDDTSGGYFDDTFMDQSINNAQREVQKLLLNAGEDYYTKCVYTTTVANQRSYDLPSDFLKVMRMEIITSGSGDTATAYQVDPITRNEQDNTLFGQSGAPSSYYISQSYFTLVPVPDSSKTVRLYYAYRVADMDDDNDTPDAPEDYHEYLAILSARDGFLRDRAPLSPIESKLMYFEKLLKENAEQRRQDKPRYVVMSGDW